MASAASQRPYVVGVFSNRFHAEEAVTALVAAGFTAREIGTIVHDEHAKLGEDEKAQAYGDAAIARTAEGALGGALLGGVLGAATALLFPGVGLVLLSGILATAAGGGIAGGFAGLISTMQLSDEEKHYYHQELQRGRCLVAVDAGDRYSEAVAILESNGALDVNRQQDATPTNA